MENVHNLEKTTVSKRQATLVFFDDLRIIFSGVCTLRK